MQNKLNQKIIKGKPLIVNAGIARAYKKQLRKLVRRSILLSRELIKKLLPQIKITYAQDSVVDDYYDELNFIRESVDVYINEYAPVYLGEVFESVDKNTTHNLERQLAKMFNTEMPNTVIPNINEPIMSAWIHNNVELIKKITSNYFDQISNNVMKIFTTGIARETLTSEIYKIQTSNKLYQTKTLIYQDRQNTLLNLPLKLEILSTLTAPTFKIFIPAPLCMVLPP